MFRTPYWAGDRVTHRFGKMEAPPLLVIVGPTAVGKTRLSLELGKAFNGEIISADSRLFYIGLNIGTAKPAQDDRELIPHHLIDICYPDETISLGQYQRLVYGKVDAIHRRNCLPMLVGGTGQYIRAVVEGWGIPEVAPNERLRQVLKKYGQDELARWLLHLDQVAAGRIDPRNVRRVIRALEVTLTSGYPITHLQRKTPPNYAIKVIGLTCDRETLYRRIDKRVDQMMEDGLLAEVTGLRQAGYRADLPSMSGLGYRQLLAYLDGQTTLDDAVQQIKFQTHRLVRQQYTWFRQDDPALTCFDITKCDWEARVYQLVSDWLNSAAG